jgi:hypothetical protein
MTDLSATQATDGVPTHLGRDDPAGRFADYAIRAVIGGVRELYDRQDFNFAGPWGDSSFIEDYTAEVRGTPLGCLHLVTFNADEQAQHIAAH